MYDENMQVLNSRGSCSLNCAEPSLFRIAHSGCASSASRQFRSGLMRATTRMPRFFAAAAHSPKKSRPFRYFP